MSNKRLNAIISIGGAVSASLKNAIGQTTAGFSKIGGAVGDLTKRQRELNAVVAQQGKLGAAGSALKVQYARQELDLIDRRIARFKTISGLEQKLAQQRAKLGESVGSLGRTVAGGALAAAPIVMSMKKGAVHDYEMTKIKITQGLTADQKKSLDTEIGATSRAHGLQLGDTREAYSTFSSGGLDFEKSKSLLGETAKMTTAIGADVKDIASLQTSTTKILGLAADRVNEIVFTGGQLGSFEAKAQARYLPTLVAGGKASGMVGEQGLAGHVAGLQVTRDASGTDEEAQNNLRNYQDKFLSNDTLKHAKKLGFDPVKLQQQAVKNGTDFQEDFTRAAMKATKGRPELIAQLFPDRQARSGFIAMSQGIDRYVKIRDEALKSRGAVDAAHQEMLASDKIQMDMLGQSADRFAITLGGAMNKIFGGQHGLADRVDKTADWIKDHTATVGAITAVGVAVGGFVLAVKAGKVIFEAGELAVTAFKWAAAKAAPPVGTLAAETGALGGAAGAASGGVGSLIGSLIGKAGLVYALSSVALEAAKMLGLPDTDRKKGEEAWKNGEYLKASALLPAGSFFAHSWRGVTGQGQDAKVGNAAKPLGAPSVAAADMAGMPMLGSALQARDLAVTPTGAVSINGAPATQAPIPPLPAPAPPPVVNNITNNYEIKSAVTTKTEMNAQDVANETMRLIKRSEATAQRSRMFDGASH